MTIAQCVEFNPLVEEIFERKALNFVDSKYFMSMMKIKSIEEIKEKQKK